MKNQAVPGMLLKKQIANRLNIDPRTLAGMRLPKPTKIGKRLFYRESDLSKLFPDHFKGASNES